MASYKLRCSIFAHDKDVRGLAQLYNPESSFVSVSRDLTSRLWVPNNDNVGFTQTKLMKKHKNFVSCVCVTVPTSEHPDGLIVTGSNDSSILVFIPTSDEPLYTMKEHTNAVCSLAASNFETLISGSWDNTAKCWLHGKCFMTLEGHQGAVWSVAMIPSSGLILTASADKTIKIWKAGKLISTLQGHTDCVRMVVVVDGQLVLSCSNDATIRLWNVDTFTCVKVLLGHTNFIYSLAILSTGFDHFASCGEDKTVRVWKGGECVQVINLPVTSIWSVCALCNGDIVVGSSDGVIRVFTEKEERFACEEELKNFEELATHSTIPSQIGDINTDDLPGPEALMVPGRREGQSLMVRRANNIEIYNWNDNQWVKVGDVIGGVGEERGSKSSYHGKEYDYIFDVDLGEGHPALKLPYNCSDDPYQVADEFMANNGLSSIYREQIVDFILNKAGGNISSSTEYRDPFTGGNRYVPNLSQAVSNHGQPQLDPFTGAHSYTSNNFKKNISNVQYFPETNYIKFDQINTKGLFDKLQEFNQRQDGQQLSSDDIHILDSFMNLNTNASNDRIYQILSSLLLWPSALLFPVLDLLRFSFINESFMDKFLFTSDSTGFINIVHNILVNDSSVKNRYLVVRGLCNCFQHSKGEQFIKNHLTALLNDIHLLINVADKQVQISTASFLLNTSVLMSKAENLSCLDTCTQLVGMLVEALSMASDDEACFRLLVGAGTISQTNPSVLQLAKSLDVLSCLTNNPVYRTNSSDKLATCLLQFTTLMQT